MSFSNPNRVAIVAANRIPFARAHGAYASVGNEDMMTVALRGLVEKTGLQGQRLGDVSLGAVIKHSKDWNLARESVLGSGLSRETPAFDIQRACGTGLSAAIQIANKIALGQIDAGIAGGCDTVSDAPIVYARDYQQLLLRLNRQRDWKGKLKTALGIRPRHFKPEFPGVTEPRTGLSMGESCEVMAKEWGISREAQDQLALDSHLKTAAAYAEGFYQDLVTPYLGLEKDNNMRADSSMEKLAKLKPAFDRKSGNGTLTAGNSTPLTDGASCALLATESWAREHNLPVMAYLSHCEVAAVDFLGGEGLLMAPAYAVSRMLDKADLTFEDFDLFEIHEAFAAQVLCTLAAWESDEFCRERLGRDTALGSIDRSKLNPKGSSLAQGHPFGATGTRILGIAAKQLQARGSGRALISICTGGGMGVTAILEAN
ncbi:MAG: acetyl-CoA C-acetyltransferase [Gammaproteobacteria bacterium]|nr:acetyl-CoA C-acetyltransferase [Gammaproteobacteria bacterium]NNM14726.1 acetyl-CoA C-acetyltransferase [Gammaproteobacteria bacterium]